ncbi:MAG: hypothetical protein HQK52_14855 [Oligoflexia bacterium]|nr:hypothetical protein [Oligoflexia bacterium]
MKKLLRNLLGFSLVEIMIATSLMGGLTLALMQITKNQNVSMKRLESSSEIITTKTLIENMLLDENACLKTMGTNPLTNGMTFSAIKDKNNVNFITVGAPIANVITVESIQLLFVGTPVANEFNNMTLKITFKHISSILTNSKIPKDLTLRVRVDSSNVVTDCFSDLDNAILTAKQEVCSNFGGTPEVGTDKCILPISTSIPGDDYNVAAVNYVQSNYVPKIGSGGFIVNNGSIDVNNGSIDVNSGNVNVTSGGVCIDGNCRTTFANQACANTQVARGLNSSGTLQCASADCPTNQLFQGYNADGTPRCVLINNSNCGANTYVQSYNQSTQTVVCAPITIANCGTANKYLHRADAGGFSCGDVPLIADCPGEQVVYGPRKCAVLGASTTVTQANITNSSSGMTRSADIQCAGNRFVAGIALYTCGEAFTLNVKCAEMGVSTTITRTP